MTAEPTTPTTAAEPNQQTAETFASSEGEELIITPPPKKKKKKRGARPGRGRKRNMRKKNNQQIPSMGQIHDSFMKSMAMFQEAQTQPEQFLYSQHQQHDYVGYHPYHPYHPYSSHQFAMLPPAEQQPADRFAYAGGSWPMDLQHPLMIQQRVSGAFPRASTVAENVDETEKGQGVFPLPEASGAADDVAEAEEGEVEEMEQEQQANAVPLGSAHIPQPIVPKPKREYLSQSLDQPQQLPSPQPLLVILDLNGTLGYRKSRTSTRFRQRYELQPFLKTLLEKYKVMIWSSSQPATVDMVCTRIFHRDQRSSLVAEWDRTKFGLTDLQYNEKVQVYKQLETVWGDNAIQASYPEKLGLKLQGKSFWDQSNTVLVDDSALKAASQPFNILQVPEYRGFDEERDILFEVLVKLDILARYDDVTKVLQLWAHNCDTDEVPCAPHVTREEATHFRRNARKNAHAAEVLKKRMETSAAEMAKNKVQNETQKAINAKEKALEDEWQLVIDTERARLTALEDAKLFEERLLVEISESSAAANADVFCMAAAEKTVEPSSSYPDDASQAHVINFNVDPSSSTSGGSSQDENYLLDRLEEALFS